MPEVETMFYVRSGGVPWHGLGTPVEEAPDSEAALIKAGLAWAVEQRPVIVNGKRVPGVVANVRATDGEVLGIVSDRYRVIQNWEAFAWTDALLDEGVRYETAGSLRGGRRVWLLARLPERYEVRGDDVDTYLCFTNAHDGIGAVRVAIAPIRVVCMNTLNLFMRKARRSWSARHTGDVRSRLEEARRTLELARHYMEELGHLADRLAQIRVDRSEWQHIVETLLPLPDPESVKRESTIERAREEQLRLYSAMLVDDLEPHRWTAWGAVNAVADYVSHAHPMRWTTTFKERRFEKVVITGHPMLDKALALVA